MYRTSIKIPAIDPETQVVTPPFKGVLLESANIVIVSDINHIHGIMKLGRNYGEFVYFNNEDQAAPNKVEKLILTSYEAFYLLNEKKVLEVFNSRKESLTAEQLWNIFLKDIRFIFIYAAYEYYSKAKLYVKPCTKHGGVLSLYSEPPNIVHSFSVVFIQLWGVFENKYPTLFDMVTCKMMNQVGKKNKIPTFLVFDWPKNFRKGEGVGQLIKREYSLKKMINQANQEENSNA